MTNAIVVAGMTLEELEKVIDANLLSFMVVGTALMDIRDNHKYEAAVNPDTGDSYRSFTEYLRGRWPTCAGYAYYCITGATIRAHLQDSTTVENLPVAEGQIRALAKLASPLQVKLGKADPQEWDRGWQRAIALAGDRPPTEKHVKQAVNEILKMRKAANLPEPLPQTGDGEGVFVGDATSTEWLDSLTADTFDMVLTDPPWAEDSITAYSAVGRAAVKCLRPGGVCAVYFGKVYLPEVIRAVNDYLDYEWMFCFYYPESQVRIRKAAVYDCWRPVGLFRKPGPHELPAFSRDILQAPREKGSHPWQQALEPARELIQRYTRPGALILDPFVGAGTFALAAKLEGRRYVAFDISADTVKLAQKRLTDGE